MQPDLKTNNKTVVTNDLAGVKNIVKDDLEGFKLPTVQAVQHRTVQGKLVYYLKILNNNGDEFYVSVGAKTFKKVHEMTTQLKIS